MQACVKLHHSLEMTAVCLIIRLGRTQEHLKLFSRGLISVMMLCFSKNCQESPIFTKLFMQFDENTELPFSLFTWLSRELFSLWLNTSLKVNFSLTWPETLTWTRQWPRKMLIPLRALLILMSPSITRLFYWFPHNWPELVVWASTDLSSLRAFCTLHS